MSLGRGELLRKAVHISMGGFALALRDLEVLAAASCALGALAFNVLVLPRLGLRSLLRPRDVERGWPVGIVLYPVTVLILIVLFPSRPELAACGWAFLAFGDGLASAVGQTVAGPRLPWNRAKSWSGLLAYVVAGSLAATGLYAWVSRRAPETHEVLAILMAAVVGSVLESLPSELDDNLVAPLVATLALAALLPALPGLAGSATPEWQARFLLATLVNLVVAVSAGVLGVVRPSGVSAGFAAGTFIWAFGGLPSYFLLWTFFAFGTLATRFGRARKEAIGKAEEAGGRRGAANVLANGAVAAFCAAVAALLTDPSEALLFRLAAVAAFATALGDTVGTEVGQAVRSPTFLLPDFRRVAPGTDGAVSVAGTLAGLLAAAALAAVAGALGLVTAGGFAIAVLAAFLGSVFESLLGREGTPWRVTNGHVLNLYNTLFGASLAYVLARALASFPR